ncbi:MAG: sensor histidine kinase [Aureispira sp.]
MIDLSLMVQALDDIVFLIDETLVFRQYWVAREEMLWMPLDAFLGKNISTVFPKGMGNVDINEKIKQVFSTKKNEKFLYQSFGQYDEKQWYRIKLHLTDRFDQEGKQLLLVVVEEHTEQVVIQKNKHLFQSLVDQNWDAIRYSDLDLTIRYVNSATNRLYGYEEGELIGEKVNLLTADSSIDIEEVKNLILEKGSWAGDVWQMRKDQTRFEAFLSIQLMKDDDNQPIGFVSQSKDISERKETAAKLKRIIAERETLLKEIHHRVKNNLQVITSLLSLQSNMLADEKIRGVFQQSQYRINAMATIHETLYRSNNFMGIDYRQYLMTLSEYLLLSMKGNKHQITLHIDVPPVVLSLDTAIPLGLLVNEIITNALKYGIVGEQQGKITIQLTPKKAQKYELYIGDNGLGYSEKMNFNNTTSLGLKLIQNLARQLNGTIERLYANKGTYYKLLFLGILYETPMNKEKQPN